jgi:murein DD-endopeptidase MepM/ murein hydrolase activator NlpD
MGKRDCDSQGCGFYGASRSGGTRKHNGIDLCQEDGTSLPVGTEIQTGFAEGEVVKVGWAYGDPNKSHLRYVAIRVKDYFVRVFYIEPTVKVGDKVYPDTVIGKSLSLGEFYEGITEHVHFEVYSVRGEDIHNRRNFKYYDPNLVLNFI